LILVLCLKPKHFLQFTFSSVLSQYQSVKFMPILHG
jgi:hypothetical protein